MCKKFILTGLLLFHFGAIYAFNNLATADTTTGELTRDYIVSLDMGSNKVYKGIQPAQKQFYLSPGLAYYAKKGFFISTAGYYLTKTDYHFDELDGTIGWDFNLFKKKLKASVSYSRYEFSSHSTQVNSTLNNNVEVFFKKKFSWIKTKLAFDYYFGTDTDFYITLDNSHSFDWDDVFTDDDELSFIPKVSLAYGTQNYYKNVIKAKLKKDPSAAETVTRFVPTSLDLIFPLLYSIGDLDIEPAFRFSRALNLPKAIRAVQSPNAAYITLSLTYTFN